MYTHNEIWGRAAAVLAPVLAVLALAPLSSAATREPMSEALLALRGHNGGSQPGAAPSSRALRALKSSARRRSGSEEAQISSTAYGPEQMAGVAAVLRGLTHGPELAELSVYLATPAEISQTCGATVIACYSPSRKEMFVSGETSSSAGVSREFAIAHEYGHHIANSQQSDANPAIAGGTIRWATYERVCQLTRARKLYPGDQGAHYWANPEEAFAQSYAHLNKPTARVSWQYVPFLRPTAASLAKIRADVTRPWAGPVRKVWRGVVRRSASRFLRTPLDGSVAVSLETAPGVDLSVSIHDRSRRRPLATARTNGTGGAELSYPNCGRRVLRLDVRAVSGGGAFRAIIERP